MKKVEAPKAIEPWRIICASQSEPGYSEDRWMLIYGGEEIWDDVYVVLEGGHCSCYDWQEVQWDAVEYTRDELVQLAMNNSRSGYYVAERRFWKLVLMAVVGDE